MTAGIVDTMAHWTVNSSWKCLPRTMPVASRTSRFTLPDECQTGLRTSIALPPHSHSAPNNQSYKRKYR
jgi:hypothetical protein